MNKSTERWHTLKGKTVWVTGGAGHLGAPLTTALDRECRRTVCIDLPGKAEALVRDRSLTNTVPMAFDLSQTEGLTDFVNRTIDVHGVPNGLVHLVFTSSNGKRLEQLPAEEFQRTLDRTLPTTFALCRILAERMKENGGGSVVLFASMYGFVAPDPRIYPVSLAPNPIDYGATKAVVLQMVRYFAMHYGPAAVRFNCVTPGPFPNADLQKKEPAFIAELGRKTVLGRIGQSEEIVGPTLFLLGDGASYVTGHSLVVDGGWTIW